MTQRTSLLAARKRSAAVAPEPARRRSPVGSDSGLSELDSDAEPDSANTARRMHAPSELSDDDLDTASDGPDKVTRDDASFHGDAASDDDSSVSSSDESEYGSSDHRSSKAATKKTNQKARKPLPDGFNPFEQLSDEVGSLVAFCQPLTRLHRADCDLDLCVSPVSPKKKRQDVIALMLHYTLDLCPPEQQDTLP